MTDNIYLASIYRGTAVIFWESAKKLDKTMEKRNDGSPAKYIAIPFYFLISHAAELFLKSALLKRGWTEQDLKQFDYRHNLDRLLGELQKMGISVTSETVAVLKGLSSQHSNHALRYSAFLDDGHKTYMPPSSLIHPMLEELLLLTNKAYIRGGSKW